jgi:small subunit ribosomal protein S17
MPRKQLTGTVVSDKMEKTVVVAVETRRRHPVYHKVVKKRKKFKAHDEKGATVGDTVVIEETRPLSKTKRWKVTEIRNPKSETRNKSE